jgi:cupin 2 domain-containing protein
VSAPRFGRLAEGPSPAPSSESFSELAAAGGARVERIASRALVEGEWYDQPQDEFVLLVAGAADLAFADGSRRRLAPGDWAFLPARCRHRVAWTATDAETLWLAVHLPPA